MPRYEQILQHLWKKVGHYAKVFRSEMTPRRSKKQLQTTSRNHTKYGYNNNQQHNPQKQQQVSSQRVQIIQTAETESNTVYEEDENGAETIDRETKCYLV